MLIDPIKEEILAIKRELASRFDYDLDHIVADLQRNEAKFARNFVALESGPSVATSDQRVAASQNSLAAK